MLKLYTWNTPNGYKVPILLEELGLAYELNTVNISKEEQRDPEYAKLNPNNKIPTLVDDEVTDGGDPLVIFESGAILEYLAEKMGKFMPADVRGKSAVREWLMFQMAGIGPMFGQLTHFVRFAPEKVPYAIERYTNEVKRLLGVLDSQLGKSEFLADDYSIADIATWPWIRAIRSNDAISLDDYPNVSRWFATIDARPAVKSALQKLDAAVANAQS